ncbi:MAG: hypothetical protein H6732_13710 [Alphaproteobacteria bacterium]|nr:hypothetical protein [Alphaproteobacteria bacterium]
MRRFLSLVLLGACVQPPGGSVDTDTDGTDVASALVLATFNTGSGASIDAATGEAQGYDRTDAAWADDHLGNGIAWIPAVEDVTAWLARVRPDVIGFQELLWDGICPDLPEPPPFPSACDGWTADRPALVNRLLGEDYQVACHLGAPDKCLAVRTEVATIAGCSAPLCLDGLRGVRIDGCGKGARAGAATLELAAGGTLTVVNVHGNSGATGEDQDCRAALYDAIFVDAGEGAPLADGERNVVLGDLNQDPARLAGIDRSARRWNELVTEERGWHHLTAVGVDAPGTYGGGLVSIDHVVSDSFVGSCVAPGITEGEPPVTDKVYFDHVPEVCTARAEVAR